MKRIFTLLVLVAVAFCSLTITAQQRGERRPLTQEQIEQMMAQRAQMIKKQLNLTAEQEPLFDKEFTNYNNIVLATRTQQFKNHIEKQNSSDEVVAAINDVIDYQLAELVAKKQMINHLKDVLTPEQLTKLHMFTSGMGMGMRNNPGDQQQERRSNTNNTQRRTRQNNDWGSGFDNDDDDQ
ncbi:MAG: hypothetical protein ACI4AH_00595 [Muribaculaceae bacterium]